MPSIYLSNIEYKFLVRPRFDPRAAVEKQDCYLCAMQPLPPPKTILLFTWNSFSDVVTMRVGSGVRVVAMAANVVMVIRSIRIKFHGM